MGLVRIGLGGGVEPPPSFSSPLLPSLLPSFLLLLVGLGKGGVLLLLGGGFLPPWCAYEGRLASPSLLYIREEGDTLEHIKVDLIRVRCPPPQISTSVISL